MDSSIAGELSLMLPNHGHLQKLAKRWLKDDAPMFDIGGFVVGDGDAQATLLAKSPGVVAGRPFVQAVLDAAELNVEWLVEDGFVVSEKEAAAKKPIAVVSGSIRSILLVERTALNIISRASGVATLSKRLSEIKTKHSWNGEIAATRKTTPGFGLIEKYAVLVGGCSTHRMSLSQMTMLKDNHIWSVGSITKAVKKARKVAGFSSKIEVECLSLNQAREAAQAGADVVMLDNYTPSDAKADSRSLKSEWPHLLVEVSGGITVSTISDYFDEGIDIISCGNLTHGYPVLDYSLKVVP